MHPLGWPLWCRCLIAGLAYGVALYAVGVGGRAAELILGYPVVGVVLGLMLWPYARAHERKLYGDLTGDERVAVMRAVRAHDPPRDARLRDAGARLAHHWTSRQRQPRNQLIVFALLELLAVFAALTMTAWGWAAVVLLPPVAWYSVRIERRQRLAALRFLHAMP
ncbi:hypothetical protein [Mangrovihabitans endophyticus]|uniref:Uncharacterized protein n=1 Tax=Mangrovihabitans endophyticus TaxID=1751298 RepID=A0A8J3FPV9_9ACTN|nr:hypothetical protein [Mangrovihabitans endophyticus]GGK95830.1 hypothetical protein GCM10012284_32480 [Mangrovihabitans endophyticus]